MTEYSYSICILYKTIPVKCKHTMSYIYHMTLSLKLFILNLYIRKKILIVLYINTKTEASY